MVRLKAAIIDIKTSAQIFQFLMVRLKVLANAYSPIDVHAFQFLMVRLKGFLLFYSSFAINKFQFLMVRLKERYNF